MTGTTIHLLDVGALPYGDAVLCEFGDRVVLIDGGHPGDDDASGTYEGITAQLRSILGHEPPFALDLLVVSHAHLDHIGCLPALVAAGALAPRFALVSDPDLGWGRSPADPPPDAARSRSDAMVAALREPPLPARVADDATAGWLADAVDLETSYRAMLSTLEAAGTTVVRLGQDDIGPLVAEFASIGMHVLGPSLAQLLACADAIRGASDDLAGRFADALAPDAAGSRVDAYRRLVAAAGASDAQDAVSRLGAAVNLQSSVLTFEVDGARYLFAGDMQFVKPGVGTGGVPAEVAALRSLVAASAPYAFAKLSHHGSDNATDDAWLAALGATPALGICAGSGSTKHPNPAVLSLLAKRQGALHWGRTDHNGAVTIRVDAGQVPAFTVTRGALDDAQPNTADTVPVAPVLPLVAAPVVQATAAPSSPPAVSVLSVPGPTGDPGAVEVTARFPASVGRLQISVEVGGSRPAGDPAPPAIAPPGAPVAAAVPISPRQAPPLLFVTSPDALSSNIGADEARAVLADLHGRPGRVLELPAGSPVGDAVGKVTAALTREVAGVVLVGGFDVVPSQRVDVLPAAIRAKVDGSDDADNFIVWSDDAYGDTDGDGLPEAPVSRIPDGRSSDLVLAALDVPRGPISTGSRGLRNVERPFADGVYAALPAPAPMLVAAPVTFRSPELSLAGRNVYLMLHGDYVDGGRFWGEQTPGGAEAMNTASVPPSPGAVILAGACWGALTVDTPAARVMSGRPFGQRVPAGSIALSFLLQGARGFVGCTGSHYSPLNAPYGFYGGPMHTLFWQGIAAGMGPAAALLAAKQAYVPGIPHGPGLPGSLAIELKVWREFTCLGLGW